MQRGVTRNFGEGRGKKKWRCRGIGIAIYGEQVAGD